MNAMKKMAMALALIGTVGGAQAFTLNNLDGTYNNFGGFDWASSGSVWIKDYNFLNNKNAGFSKADASSLYLPIDSDINRPTVAKQKNKIEFSLRR